MNGRCLSLVAILQDRDVSMMLLFMEMTRDEKSYLLVFWLAVF